MKQQQKQWVSLLVVVGIALVSLLGSLAAGWSPKLGLDLDGGLSVTYQTHVPVSASELSTIVTILGDRVNSGTNGATVESQGKNQIVVSIPGEKNAGPLLRSLGNTGQLFFRPALCYAPPVTLAKGQKVGVTATVLPTCATASQLTATNLDVNTSTGNPQGNPAADTQFAPYASTSADNDKAGVDVLLPQVGSTERLVLGPAGMSGTGVHSASAQVQSGQWVVLMNLNSKGASEWDTLAQQQFHAIIGVDLDGQIISAPITYATQGTFQSFGGKVEISGSFSETEAKNLAADLNFGALPVKLDQLYVQSVSPTEGKSSLHSGLLAGLAGLVLVMLYVLVYYRLLGVVVISGLAVTGALLWSIIAAMGQGLGTTIDLAGVIGIIVSVGITVDSYIVYFERLKDETRSGRTVRTSVDRGFASAFRTVLAADFVSLLGAVILYAISIGAVKGFALFLGISTVLDVFVTYFFTRPFVILLGRSRGATEAKGLGVASGLGVSGEGPA